MTTAAHELAIVGGGPAGLNAALAAADAGVEVLVLDENRDLGGQIYRAIPYAVRDAGRMGTDYRTGRDRQQHRASREARMRRFEVIAPTIS